VSARGAFSGPIELWGRKRPIDFAVRRLAAKRLPQLRNDSATLKGRVNLRFRRLIAWIVRVLLLQQSSHFVAR